MFASYNNPKSYLTGVLVLSFMLFTSGAFAQGAQGLYVLDDGEAAGITPTTDGHVTTLGNTPQFFSGIFFGFDIARDIELVQDETGVVTGYYLLDGWGGQHEVGTVPAYNVDQKPYFNWDIARDLEVVNRYRLVTDAVTGEVIGSAVIEQVGYYVLDGFGGVHPVNDTVDLPNRRASSDPFFRVFNDFPTSYPDPMNPPYFIGAYSYPYYPGFDIMRDMEVSYVFSIVTTAEGGEEIIGHTNGYYLMDGFGGIHNCRVDADQNPILAPWENVPGRPYFGWDIARDFELTPRGDGYYILDGMGGVHTVNASLSFGVGVPSTPPYFGFDIAKDMELVQGPNGSVVGYYVLDGLGTIHVLGNAPDLGQVVNVPMSQDIFRDLEVSPLYTPVTFAP